MSMLGDKSDTMRRLYLVIAEAIYGRKGLSTNPIWLWYGFVHIRMRALGTSGAIAS
jgi:hypothetical protein